MNAYHRALHQWIHADSPTSATDAVIEMAMVREGGDATQESDMPYERFVPGEPPEWEPIDHEPPPPPRSNEPTPGWDEF